MRLILIVVFCVCILPVVPHAQNRELPKREPLPIRDPMKFDEWGDLPFSDEKVRLDNVALQLRREPFTAYLIISAGRVACVGEARARAIRAKNYLVRHHGIKSQRIVWADAGYRDSVSSEVWLLPQEMGKPTIPPKLGLETNEIKLERNCKIKYRGWQNR